MASLLPTPCPLVLPLPFRSAPYTCPCAGVPSCPREEEGWVSVWHRDPLDAARNERLPVGVRIPVPLPWALDTGVGLCVCVCACTLVHVSVHAFVPLQEEAAASVNSETRWGEGHEGRGRVFTLSFRDKV